MILSGRGRVRARAELATTDLVSHLASHESTSTLAQIAQESPRVLVTGSSGSSPAYTAGALAKLTVRPVLLVVAHPDDAEEHAEELRVSGVDALLLPALETIPGETEIELDLLAERFGAIRTAAALAADAPCVVLATVHALMQPVPDESRMDELSRVLTSGDTIPPEQLIRWLDNAGYTRADAIEQPGDFALRGGILDVFTPTGAVRLDFFGDELERITEIDVETMGSDRRLDSVALTTTDVKKAATGESSFVDLMPEPALAVLSEPMEIGEQARGYAERVADRSSIFDLKGVNQQIAGRCASVIELSHMPMTAGKGDRLVRLPVSTLPPFSRDASEAVGELGRLASEQGRALACCRNEAEADRLRELLAEFASDDAERVETVVRYVNRGFVWDDGGDGALAVVPNQELFHRYEVRRRAARMRSRGASDTFLDFAPGDVVVHQDHGICEFVALTLLTPKGGTAPEEFLTLKFAKNAKLHVPASQIDRVQRYVGGFSGKPPLSTLGGTKWKNQTEKVAESVKDLAAELLRVRAAREAMPGIRYPADTAWQTEFEAEFPFDETDDQLAALAEIKKDMQSDRPMDRLLCGDVGFGKTELAIRAAFKAVEFGRQVAVLVPTTVLAEQHERTFRSRFADYPFRVESLSRFKTTREINQTLRDVRKGHVDVIIGTHRLVSKDVKFADLGLVVIDEEQRFGVEHKEALLRLRMTVDVLTMSATPIPRTLHMAMLGIRDISSLATAPVDRRAVVTEVVPWEPRRIQMAIRRELARDGQVFFVHNRVNDITAFAGEVQRMAPDARIVVGHGQMPPRELEEVMLKFVRREADILVSTTIIESGIDIPTANTMFIDNADRFGLAELHQLRGRVGRSRHRGYCYLLLPLDRIVTPIARKRLKAIEQYAMLGAGFRIAMQDLEIRGAGNIVGAEQSGHIALVGYEMYCRLLEQAVQNLKTDDGPEPAPSTSVDLGVPFLIPKPYIPSERRRLDAYRRIAGARSHDELARVEEDLTSAYGDPPSSVRKMLDLAQIRVAANLLGVRAVLVRDPDVVFRAEDTRAIGEALRQGPGQVTELPPKSNESVGEVYLRLAKGSLEPDTLLAILRKRLAGEPVPA